MTTPAPIARMTSDLVREMREGQAPSVADALRQCRDALHDVAIDCAILIKTAEELNTVDSRTVVRVANALANTKTLTDALTAADTALAAPSEPQDERVARLKFELRQAMLDYGAAERAKDPERISATTGQAVRIINELAPIASLALSTQPADDKELERRTGEPHIDGWPLYSMLPPPATKREEVQMPEPVGAVIPEGSTEYTDCVTLKQCRAYGDARALAAVREPHSMIAGALFDFAGFLTTRPTVTPFGSTADPCPAVDLLTQWADTRGLKLDEADVGGWSAGITAQAQQEGK